MSQADVFKKMLASGQDNALLRYSLANALIGEKHHAEAIEHLQASLNHDPEYSAAWKLLGKCQALAGQRDQAIDSYTRGIAVAETKGDKQAMKEMQVFVRKLQRDAR